MLRAVLFLLGILLMALSLFVPFVPGRPEWFGQSWLFCLGLTLALGSHGWPDGVF